MATVNPRTAAMAAIWPSAMEIVCPAARARLTRCAYISESMTAFRLNQMRKPLI